MKNIRHTCLCVNNLEKADFFYRKVLGLHYVNSDVEEGDFIKSLLGLDSLTWVKLATDNGDLLELYWYPQKTNNSFNHIAFTVDNIQYIRNKLKEFEIKCSEIKLDKNGKHKVMFIRDYEQNFLEIVEEINNA
jgi:catechol 2,3-dioxygenase-like lactoylglutathione lyase family enzyme